VREIWHLLEDDRSRNAVEVAERFADGKATEEELAFARDIAWNAAFAEENDARAAWAGRAAKAAAREPAGQSATWAMRYMPREERILISLLEEK
jgi:hypothetical protein